MDDGPGNGHWLTYDEIAKARGTEKVGAIRWVQRHKWRRQPGNDGMTRVLVPEGALEVTVPRPRRAKPAATDTVTDNNAVTAFEAALAAIQATHAGEIAALRGQVDAAETVATVLREQLQDQRRQAEVHAGEVAILRGKLASAEAALAMLREQSEGQLLDQQHQAEARAEALRHDLEAARRGAEKAEKALAELRQEESARVVSLNADLQAKDVEIIEQRIATDQAHARAREAQDTIEALLQRADEARKARGRLRRLWDGWRGR
jgi:chromosome segregation ATPase